MFKLFISALVFSLVSFSAAAGPLHDAVMSGDMDSLNEALNEGADVNETDYIQGTALHAAVSLGNVAMVETLLDAGANIDMPSEINGGRAAHLAASNGDSQMLELLAERGADIDAVDSLGQTPLHLAATYGHASSVEVLLSHGAELEAREEQYGRTPLLIAAFGGDIATVSALLEAGANANARDNGGRSALRFSATPASWSTAGGEDVLVLLIESGADLEAVETNGLTILGWARSRAVSEAFYGKIVATLKRLGAPE